MTKPVENPGLDHPVTVSRNAKRVVAALSGSMIADVREALVLCQADYIPAQYVSCRDAGTTARVRSSSTTYCPFKGEVPYVSILTGGSRSVDATWA